MEWITQHWDEALLAVTGLVTFASFVANLTPTDADNKVVAKIAAFINALALNFKK